MTKVPAAWILVLTVALSLPAGAAEKPAASSVARMSGTITAWDGAAKTVTVKNAAGKQTSFSWNEKTKVSGIAKLGERVTVSYEKDKDGKAWATLIRVDEAPESTKPPAP